MKIFKSRQSTEVTVITVGVTAVMVMILLTIIATGVLLSPIVLAVGLLVLIILFWFYAHSLDQVSIANGQLNLRKKMGSEIIPLADIQRVERLAFSNLTMTAGSKGFFGYIGGSMDNSKLMVNDRTKMIRIYTAGKHYTLSCESPESLIAGIEDAIPAAIEIK